MTKELVKSLREADTALRNADPNGYDGTLSHAADEIERLRALLVQWEGNCTGRHGSQSPCGFTADHVVPADRAAVEPSEPSFAGLKLVTVVDGTVPADTIEFRASDGRVLGQIRQLAINSVRTETL